MIKITVEIDGEDPGHLTLGGLGERLLLEDVLPNCIIGTPALKRKDKTGAMLTTISQMLRGFVKQQAKLWSDQP